jgi:predicted peptidase
MWYTGIVGFEYGLTDGTPRLDMIHVQSDRPETARMAITQEHKRQLQARMNNELWTDDEGNEWEYELYIPEGMEDISDYSNYGPCVWFLFPGKLESIW